MQRLKTVLFNTSFALNCMLVFLLIFEGGISLPAWVQAIGRMHPLLLHFPIVLLLLCIIWELFAGVNKSGTLEKEAIGDGLLLLTSFTAVASALMGLLLSREDGYTPDSLVWHKWGGVFISLISLAWYAYSEQLRRMKILLSFIAFFGLLAVVVTGHLGANITHGDNFLLAPVSKDDKMPNVLFEDAVIYANMVQPILKSKCVSCHNDKKAKGELVMETFELLLKGGKSGALWDSTKTDWGLMMQRIHFPLENKKHMPPAGKPQLTPDEASIIYHWIVRGPNATTKVTELPERDTLRMLASSLFNTIETDVYSFKPADDSKIKKLTNNYRLVNPLAIGSPALGVEFFGAAQFKSEQLKELVVVKEQIVSLNLNKMPVTDDDLKTIAQFVNLRKLNLSFTNIKGTGLMALAGLKELKQLSLSGTSVTAAQLNGLSSLTNLTRLFIWSTPAQLQNFSAIQKQLKNTVIETGFKGDSIQMKLNEPLVENEEVIVYDPIPLKLKHFVKGVTIRYTVDGTEPDSLLSPIYQGSFIVDKNLTLRAKAYKSGWISSNVAERVFYKAGYTIDSIRLLQPAPDLPYKLIKAGVLSDAQKGELNFRSGKWIGFKGQSMEALLYFDTVRNISSVTVSNLIDIGSYIMPPLQVEVWAGKDPLHLRLIKKINPEQPVKGEPGYLKGYNLAFQPFQEKYVKVVLVPVSKLPAWHEGKGQKGWVFTDEIFLN